ncbi:MAG: DUF3179 domain-containing protein [Bacteroidota bacterium]
MSLALLLLGGVLVASAHAQQPEALPGFRTDLSRSAIDLADLQAGGPPKDGIPSIQEPVFIAPEAAADWLAGREPVVALAVNGVARAYPLQVLIWHEIVNDVIGGTPVAVTFCPLCYSALAFERTVDGTVLSLGVSGLLRHSDMVMYDRQTETLWQQITGEAIVGTYLGTILNPVPAQILSFDQFRAAYPTGQVLSRDTGHQRPYGRNPYVGYDDISQRPFLYRGPVDDRVKPMEKLVVAYVNEETRAYPLLAVREAGVLTDTVDGVPLVLVHRDGVASALAEETIADARDIGTVGVFRAEAGGRPLTFAEREGALVDTETGSTWSLTGRATAGPLAGAQLPLLHHGTYFAFAWLAFEPDAVLVQP